MTATNPYEAPKSELPQQGRPWPAWLMLGANVTIVATLIEGLWEITQQPGKSAVAVLCAFAVPVASVLAFRSTKKWLRRTAVGLNLALIALFGLALFVAATRTGWTRPASILFPSVLILAAAVNLVSLAWQRPNNSSKPTPLRGAA